MGRLDGRVALMSGGNTGIGRPLALAYAAEGADVAFALRRARAGGALAGSGGGGRRALAVRCHVTAEAEVSAMVH